MDNRLEVSKNNSNLGTKKAAAIIITGTKTILTVLQNLIQKKFLIL